MLPFLAILGIVLAAVLLTFMMINIRHIVVGKEFRGTCSTNNPMLKNEIGECSVCGKGPGEDCKLPEVEQEVSVK